MNIWKYCQNNKLGNLMNNRELNLTLCAYKCYHQCWMLHLQRINMLYQSYQKIINFINYIKSRQKTHKTWHWLFRLQRSLRGTDLSCHSCWRPRGRQRWRSPGPGWSLLLCFDWSSSLAQCFSWSKYFSNIFFEIFSWWLTWCWPLLVHINLELRIDPCRRWFENCKIRI